MNIVNFRDREDKADQNDAFMHTGVELSNLQCIAYSPNKEWKASQEYVRILIMPTYRLL